MRAASRLLNWKTLVSNVRQHTIFVLGQLWRTLDFSIFTMTTHRSTSLAMTETTSKCHVHLRKSSMWPFLPIQILRPNKNLKQPRMFEPGTQFMWRKNLARQIYLPMGDKDMSQLFQRIKYGQRRLSIHTLSLCNSGYDRGHMAQAANSPDSMEDAFTLCNVSPQNHQMNVSL